MKTLFSQDELASLECSLGHKFWVDATTEDNLSYDHRVGLYAVCPFCGENELNSRVLEEADKLGVSLTSFNAACEFALKYNISRNARTELALLLESTWKDGVQAEQVCSSLQRIFANDR